jgi:glyoxylase-like metal-dependent hydrolase (beta-lactamase superfamily II)
MTSVTVGNVEVVSLLDMAFAFPLAGAFPSIEAEAWAPYRELYPEMFGSGEEFASNAQCYALRSGDRTILVDTGMGPQGPAGQPGNLLPDMRAKGVDPESVDTVVFTHLHFDHTGWTVSDGAAVFPNAQHLVPQGDWDFFRQADQAEGNPHVAAQIEPLEGLGKLELVSGEHAVTNEITIVPTPGHTPGHQSIVVVSGDERAFVMGDVTNHPAQVEEVEWCAGFDGDPETAIASRRAMLDRVEAEGGLVTFGHFPVPGMGHIVRAGGRRIFRAL